MIYQGLLERHRDLDEIAFIAAIRAVGRCQSIETVLSVLDRAYHKIGAKCLSVVMTAITNLKYMKEYIIPSNKRQWTASCRHTVDSSTPNTNATTDSSTLNTNATTDSIHSSHTFDVSSSSSNHNATHTNNMPMQSTPILPMQSMHMLLQWVRCKNIQFTLPLLVRTLINIVIPVYTTYSTVCSHSLL